MSSGCFEALSLLGLAVGGIWAVYKFSHVSSSKLKEESRGLEHRKSAILTALIAEVGLVKESLREAASELIEYGRIADRIQVPNEIYKAQLSTIGELRDEELVGYYVSFYTGALNLNDICSELRAKAHSSDEREAQLAKKLWGSRLRNVMLTGRILTLHLRLTRGGSNPSEDELEDAKFDDRMTTALKNL